MQRHNFLAASAVGVAASLAGAGFALAQVPTQPPTQPMQGRSNQSIREAYGRVSELIDELGLDDRDYKGHRVAAIAQLNTAKSQLLEALRVRRQLDRSQGNSDASVQYAERALGRIIDNLGRDDTDYGGHRVAALGNLRTAQSDLQQATSSR